MYMRIIGGGLTKVSQRDLWMLSLEASQAHKQTLKTVGKWKYSFHISIQYWIDMIIWMIKAEKRISKNWTMLYYFPSVIAKLKALWQI